MTKVKTAQHAVIIFFFWLYDYLVLDTKVRFNEILVDCQDIGQNKTKKKSLVNLSNQVWLQQLKKNKYSQIQRKEIRTKIISIKLSINKIDIIFTINVEDNAY